MKWLVKTPATVEKNPKRLRISGTLWIFYFLYFFFAHCNFEFFLWFFGSWFLGSCVFMNSFPLISKIILLVKQISFAPAVKLNLI